MMGETSPAEDRPYLRIDYVARTEGGRIFDTTDPAAAAKSDLAEVEASGPVVVVPGEGHLFAPLEEAIRDADPGTTIEMTVEPDEAFGIVDPGKTATFDAAAVSPDNRKPGVSVDLGGRRAVVEDVSEETVTVDFNHPLAGVTLDYEIEVLERVEGTESRAAGLATTHGLRGVSVEYDDDSAVLTVRYSATAPDADRDSRLRSYVGDIRRLLGTDSVTVITNYRTDPEE